MILVILSYALFGLSFALGKLILNYATPIFAVGTRMIAGGLILMGYIIIRHRASCYPRLKNISAYAQLASFHVFIPYVLRLWALQYTTTIKAALLFNLMPFFTAILAYYINKERLEFWQITGLVIGFLGMIPILLTESHVKTNFISFSFISLPELAIIVSVASMSYGLIVMQKLVTTSKCPPYLANCVSMLSGGTAALWTSTLLEHHPIKAGVLPLCGVLGLQICISNVCAVNLQAMLLKRYSSTFMAFASFLAPLFASFYGMILFGEKITWHFFASLITVAIALTLFSFGKKKSQQPSPTKTTASAQMPTNQSTVPPQKPSSNQLES
jgi:drug/metabolite transporter (DMT)-like permease